ncbi:MAG: TrkH family potassium uptake protein [Chloroflexota bacterium]
MRQRQRAYLWSRYRSIVGYLGGLTFVIGAVNLLPLPVLLFFPEEWRYAPVFVAVAVVMMAGGGWVGRRYRPSASNKISMQESAIVVTATWLIAILSSALPLWAVGGLTFTQAVFESCSGWTTTGLSFVDVTTTPHIVLMYRSILQLLGGAGLVILALTAESGPINYGLSVMEGRSDKLAPHVKRSARLVALLYGGYTVGGVVALWLVGMGPFDALNHAFTAVSTGGFSTQATSIGHFDSAPIEAVIIVLMILGNVNFLTAWILLQGKFRAIGQNGELRLFAFLVAVSAVLLLALVTLRGDLGTGQAIRVAVFEAVSAFTGTGYSTVGYTGWSDIGWLILIVLMIAGGGSGSTAGGLKQFRVFIMLRAVQWEVRKAFLPKHAVNEPAIWQGEKFTPLTDERVRQVGLFISLYMFILLVGTLVMTGYGYGLRESLFEFASTLGTVGLSVGVTTSDTPGVVVWMQTIAMFLGRLEFFAVIIGTMKLAQDGRLLVRG